MVDVVKDNVDNNYYCPAGKFRFSFLLRILPATKEWLNVVVSSKYDTFLLFWCWNKSYFVQCSISVDTFNGAITLIAIKWPEQMLCQSVYQKRKPLNIISFNFGISQWNMEFTKLTLMLNVLIKKTIQMMLLSLWIYHTKPF